MTGATPVARVPRYLQVSATLQQRIEAGDYPLGALLPTEIELSEAFAVNRHTVRDALRRLADAGFVQRHQGSGSQVVSLTRHRAYVQSMRSLNELFQYAADTRFRIDRMEMAVPDPALRVNLDGAALDPWLVVEGLRVDPAGDRPICWSSVLIHRAYAGVAHELTSHGGTRHGRFAQTMGGARGAALSRCGGRVDAGVGQPPFGRPVLLHDAPAPRWAELGLSLSPLIASTVHTARKIQTSAVVLKLLASTPPQRPHKPGAKGPSEQPASGRSIAPICWRRPRV